MNASVSKEIQQAQEQLQTSSNSEHQAATTLSAVQIQAILDRAKQYALDEELDFAGGVPPKDAWALVRAGAAVLVDVRSNEERKFVGHVPAGEHVAWATGTSLNRNPRFVKELEIKLKNNKEQVVVLLCRSGKRSALAAEAAAKAGFTQVYNILEGFEGELNEQQQRGDVGGWRHAALPWVQD
ncbi:rhodanese-like domain-containing protein [Aquirhabdus sp.]|uniref:rhodanese-like domain-containing protein n=1 Tax=Aquirhabdus sp. TaxID=2824160 RepID=UPI00396C8925